MKNKKEEIIPYYSPGEIIGEKAAELKRLNKVYVGETVSRLALPTVKKYIQSGKILDTGISSGGFCKILHQAGYKELFAVDIDDYRDEEIKDIIEFKKADLSFQALDWSNDSFECVTAWCLLPHLENPHNFIREAFRVLKSGGYFIFSMPNITSLMSRKKFFLRGEIERFSEQNDHIAILTPAIIKKTILKYFALVEILYFTDVEKIANGRLGFFKKIALLKNWFGRKYFEKIYGHNIVYVLRKPLQ